MRRAESPEPVWYIQAQLARQERGGISDEEEQSQDLHTEGNLETLDE